MSKINVRKDEKVIAKIFIGEPVQGGIILLGRSFLLPAAPSFPANVSTAATAILEAISLARNQNK